MAANTALRQDSTFLLVLYDMDKHFENVRGELYPLNNNDEQRYEAKVHLAGMRNFGNEPDIIYKNKYCSYSAEYGPYFNSEDLDKQKEIILYRARHSTADKWWSERIDGGMRFTEIANPLKSISVYSFYGDGSGMYVKVLFKVLTE